MAESFEEHALWVDKYTSLKYFDLLTDEQTNRNVLSWLKTWDEVVFPENPTANLKVPDYLHQRSNYQLSSGLKSGTLSNF